MVDVKQAKANLLKREASKQAARRRRFAAAASDFEAILQMIIARYAPKRIVQWGSLLLFGVAVVEEMIHTR